MSDAQTERRMLEAGLRMVDSSGLTVSLEHLSLEAVIADAGVARASVYRRWPYKDLYFGDLLLELARATQLAVDATELVAGVARELANRADELLDDRSRADLVVDLLHGVVHADCEIVARSARWRTYVALHVTYDGLPDSELRTRVAEALVATEREFLERRAETFAVFTDLVGYRLRPGRDRDDGFRSLSFALGCAATGIMVRAMVDPGLLTRTTSRTMFGGSVPLEWSEPAVLEAGLVLGYVEPDPDVVWDESRVGWVRDLASSWPAPSPREADGSTP